MRSMESLKGDKKVQEKMSDELVSSKDVGNYTTTCACLDYQQARKNHVALLMMFAAKAFEVEDLLSSLAEQKILPNTTKTKIALSLGQDASFFFISETEVKVRRKYARSNCAWAGNRAYSIKICASVYAVKGPLAQVYEIIAAAGITKGSTVQKQILELEVRLKLIPCGHICMMEARELWQWI
ncbi:hypothetical protein Tco_0972791 [Tanacetum coccineum]